MGEKIDCIKRYEWEGDDHNEDDENGSKTNYSKDNEVEKDFSSFKIIEEMDSEHLYLFFL